jgi:hypothetical protein
MVGVMVRERRLTKGVPCLWAPRAGCLSIGDREQILLGIGRGDSLSAIARILKRSPSTVTREVNADGGREQYSAWRSHQRARARSSAQELQAGSRQAASRGQPPSASAVVTPGDRPSPTVGLSRRAGYAREPRDDLPIIVRLRSWRAAPRARSLPTLGAHGPPAERTRGQARSAAGDGDDLRTPCRSGGPSGAWALGGRPHPRSELPQRSRHPRGALQPARPAAAHQRRPLRCGRGCSDAQSDHHVAARAEEEHHLGPGCRDVKARELHHRDRDPDLLL